jgi:hypothetical protein
MPCGFLRHAEPISFPGGLAFSINSVGHMAKACGIAKIMNGMNNLLDINDETFIESKVDSLVQALEFAMRTIDIASNSIKCYFSLTSVCSGIESEEITKIV